METVTVDVPQGTLRGRKTTSKSGGTYYSFQGIPYAKPPVGPLRFKVAEPPEPWSGIRDALKEGSTCTQFNPETKQFEGTEDCLYLNVYSQQLPANTSENLLKPVMVWIHGGGFIYGSGNTDDYGPDYLVDEGVVVVTINYRLGIFGFLYMNDSSAPGNLGMKDQVAALRWVQTNIGKFGGDPNNVTIFGESAGGASVHYHMLSPMSKGLFARVIAQSGVAINPWALTKNPREVAFKIGKAFGFRETESRELVEFLQRIDHLTLVKSVWDELTSESREGIGEACMGPVVEVEVEGVDRFLPGRPAEMLEKGQYQDIPFMAGITDKEGISVLVFARLNDAGTLDRTEKNFQKCILPLLRVPKNYTNGEKLVSRIRQKYMANKPLNKDSLDGFIDIFTDIYFSESVHYTLKKMAIKGKAPLYNYMFSYDGKLNFFKLTYGLETSGACHEDEIGYLFRIKTLDADLPPDSDEVLTRSRMVKLWTNFAKTGNPTPERDSFLPVTWPQYTAKNPYYLEIGEELNVKKNLLKERMEFWEELYRTM